MVKKISIKSLSTLLAVLMVLSLFASFPISADAATSGTTGKCKWTKSGTTLAITGNGKMGSYDYYKDPAPWGKDITTVIVGDGVTEIGAQSFSHCEALTLVILPSTVTLIDSGAFDNCTSLEQITIPEGVQTIKSRAFAYSGLTSVRVPSTVTWLDYYSFYQCKSLKTANVTGAIRYLDGWTFEGCSSLESVELPDSVEFIGTASFATCPKLKSIKLPPNLKSIGDSAFYGDSSLEMPDIPDTVIKMDSYAFVGTPWYKEQPEGMVYLKDFALRYKGTPPEKVVIRPGTKRLANRLFRNQGLDEPYTFTEIELPDSLVYIGTNAFYKCDCLESVTIPGNVEEIGAYAFDACSKLSEVTFGNGLKIIGESAFRGTAVENISFPNGLEKINTNAFANCTKLTAAVIPASVTLLGDSAFSGCTALKDAVLTGGDSDPGDYLFKGCTSLENVTLGEGIITLKMAMFQNCTSLAEIVIPDGTENIYSDVFYGCTSLCKVVIPESLTNFNTYAFEKTDILTLYGYKGSTAQEYAKNRGIKFVAIDETGDCTWRKNGTVLTISGSGKTADYSEENPAPWGTDITEVIVEDGITRIGSYAFYGCKELSKITVPGTLTMVGSRALNGTAWFGRQGDGAVYLNNIAVGYNGSPKNVTVKNNTVCVAEGAFEGCESLNKIELPYSVTEVGSNAFKGCTALTEAYVPYSVKTLGSGAFESGVLTMFGFDDSKAKTFATNNKIPFTVIGGSTGDVKWRQEGGTLTIFGKGGTGGYFSILGGDRPWDSASVKKLVIEEGVTRLGTQLFSDLDNLETAVIASTVTEIGNLILDAMPKNADYTIYGYSGSYAQTYAEKKSIPFVAIGEKGDVNLDGKVDINDATLVQKYLARMTDLSQKSLDAADTNKDGNVSINDVTLIQKYVAKLIPEF